MSRLFLMAAVILSATVLAKPQEPSKPQKVDQLIKNVVISGVWYTGKDAASARDFGPGSVVVMPADWVHVSGCRAGSECVLYQEGKGKFDFKPAELKNF